MNTICAKLTPHGPSKGPLAGAIHKEKELERERREQEAAQAARERQQVEQELAAAAEVKKKTRSLADHNSLALDQLNESVPVQELAEFLGAYEDRLNQNPPGDHHFYRTTVPLSAEHMTLVGGWDSLEEGWLTLDRGGIHLIQIQDRVMGEDCYQSDSSSPVRPCLPVRLYDQIMGHKDREVLAQMDLPAIEKRIGQAIEEARQIAGQPPGPAQKFIHTQSTQRHNNTFKSV